MSEQTQEPTDAEIKCQQYGALVRAVCNDFGISEDAGCDEIYMVSARRRNSRAAMLETLEDADQLLGYFHWDSAGGRRDKFELVQKIRAAIANAKSE